MLFWLVVVAAFLQLAAVAAQDPYPPICPKDLPDEIRKRLANPELEGSKNAVLVEVLGSFCTQARSASSVCAPGASPAVLFDQGGDWDMIPASNNKVSLLLSNS